MLSLREEAFFNYLNEREQIRLRKEADLPYPWTDDPILSTYKFTNVNRHHDKTSSVLREKFYGPNFHDDRRSILMNAALFRYFGTWEFAEAIGWVDFDDWIDREDEIKDLAASRLASGLRVFTGAYVITNGGISAPKYEVVVDHYLSELYWNIRNICLVAQRNQSWKEVAETMMTIQGFGGTGFMTKEILLDTTYTGFWEDVHEHSTDGTFSYPSDWKTWTPIGPGALRGASRVLGDNEAKKVTNTVALQVITVLCRAQECWWKGNELVPTDIQFALCEFDKYERVRLNQGRPRSKYKVKP